MNRCIKLSKTFQQKHSFALYMILNKIFNDRFEIICKNAERQIPEIIYHNDKRKTIKERCKY